MLRSEVTSMYYSDGTCHLGCSVIPQSTWKQEYSTLDVAHTTLYIDLRRPLQGRIPWSFYQGVQCLLLSILSSCRI